MRRLAVAAVFVCAVSASAQSVDLELGGLRAGIRVEGVAVEAAPAPQAVVVVQPPPRVLGADRFRVDYALSAQPRLVVTQPEGATAQVWSDEGLEGQLSVPFSFDGRGERYYRVILFGADGAAFFDRKLELKSFKQATLSLRGPQVVVVQAPPAVAVQAAPVYAAPAGLAPSDFAALVAAVEGEDFSSDKLGVIRTAVGGGAWFTCAQVGQLVDLLDMGDDKVQVVALTRSRLVDPNNGFSLTSRFTFSSDKEKVRKLLGS